MTPSPRPIRIVTDSASDIPRDIARRLQITVVPMAISFGEQTFSDQELTPDDFWRRAHGAAPPKTSQPPTGAFIAVFEELIDAGFDVICITLTSVHSGTYNSAWSAASRFAGQVTVLDSRSISLAMGWQVMRAAEMALAGASREEIVAMVMSMRSRMRLFVQLDSIEFIRRGGRLNMVMPAIDRMVRALNIKPILNMAEGQLRLLGAARSTGKGLARMASELSALGALEMVQVMHIRAAKAAAALVTEIITATQMTIDRISVGEAGQVLACHGGEGVVGVMALIAG